MQKQFPVFRRKKTVQIVLVQRPCRKWAKYV